MMQLIKCRLEKAFYIVIQHTHPPHDVKKRYARIAFIEIFPLMGLSGFFKYPLMNEPGLSPK